MRAPTQTDTRMRGATKKNTRKDSILRSSEHSERERKYTHTATLKHSYTRTPSLSLAFSLLRTCVKESRSASSLARVRGGQEADRRSHPLLRILGGRSARGCFVSRADKRRQEDRQSSSLGARARDAERGSERSIMPVHESREAQQERKGERETHTCCQKERAKNFRAVAVKTGNGRRRRSDGKKRGKRGAKME